MISSKLLTITTLFRTLYCFFLIVALRCEEVGECANTLVGGTCDTRRTACMCGDVYETIEYHGADYCKLPLIGESCEDVADNCLGRYCIHVL